MVALRDEWCRSAWVMAVDLHQDSSAAEVTSPLTWMVERNIGRAKEDVAHPLVNMADGSGLVTELGTRVDGECPPLTTSL